jgi:hypothetical protein
MQAFMPGLSPPEVITPILRTEDFMMVAVETILNDAEL